MLHIELPATATLMSHDFECVHLNVCASHSTCGMKKLCKVIASIENKNTELYLK